MPATVAIIALLGIILALNSAASPALAQPVSSGLLQEKLRVACSFLKSLYNPALRLVRTTPGSSVYYISSDNLLAVKALSSCDPITSQAINQSISSCCGNGDDGMHEALLVRSISLPIHTSTTTVVANSSQGGLFNNVSPSAAGGNYAVLEDKNNGPGIFPDCSYEDVTVYIALQLKLEGNTTGAQQEMDCLNLMFDGRGMVDEPYKDGSGSEHGIYQTYKLALYIYALQKISSPHYYRLEETLLRSQGLDGGFHTGYDQAGTYVGTQENAETTSIVMIALSALSTRCNHPFVCVPSWVIFLFTGLAVAAVGVVIAILVLEQRKLRPLSPSQAARILCVG